MNKEFAKKWIKALRSGKYKQNRGNWVDDYDAPTEFCCLSVALTEAGKFEEWHGRCVHGARKEPAADLLDLNLDEIDNFVVMNDFDKKSFSEIADYIEENYVK